MSESVDARGLCETLPQAALLLDSDLRLAYANQAACELLGVRDWSGGVSWLELSLDTDRRPTRRDHRAAPASCERQGASWRYTQ